MKRHPNKAIRAAVAYALARGWRFAEPGRSAHAWGFLYCPDRSRAGHIFRVWSTPRSPEDHAKDLRRTVDACPDSLPLTP